MAKALKYIYNKTYLQLLSNALQKEHRTFNSELFFQGIIDDVWESRELKARMRHITEQIAKQLPKEYAKAIKILKASYEHMKLDFNLENMIFQDFVEVYGLDYFEISMDALEHFTKESSSEFAIRKFILKEPERTMNQMKIWAKSSHLDVRRLASEGCRPRLPWASRIPFFQKNPKMVIEVLNILKDDESTYVRTSVANNLNDISKDNPLIFIKTIKDWYGKNSRRDKMLQYASRTLLKQNNATLMQLFGYEIKNISIKEIQFTENVKIGEKFEFTCTICSSSSLGNIFLECVVDLVRKKGENRKKSFKIFEGYCSSDYKVIHKLISFYPITTRKYYEGEHLFSIKLNGQSIYSSSFYLHEN